MVNVSPTELKTEGDYFGMKIAIFPPASNAGAAGAWRRRRIAAEIIRSSDAEDRWPIRNI